MLIETIYQIDYTILNAIQLHRTDALNVFWRAITFLGDRALLWFLLIAFYALVRKEWKTSLGMTVSLGGTAVVCSLIIKNLVQRPRPYAMFPEILHLVTPSDPFSFPSAHTATSFAVATVLFFYHKKAGTACYVAAACIGFSRLYLGVHYPSDVLAGIVFGVLGGIIGYFITSPIYNTLCKWFKKSAD